ncbi:MAG: ABC transporter permease [Lachnospiraceae bacterium]|nr:ABC transporter permease [Lachnospiraceae bacterium]
MEQERQKENGLETWRQEYRRMRRIWMLRNNRTELMMLLVLLVGGSVMSLVSPTFFTKGNLLNICSQQSTTALMAIGMTLVIITSGIDLSVGTLLGFAGMLAAIELQATGNVAKALGLAYGVALLVGIVNGFLIGYKKLPAFIVTLGTQLICQSMNYVVTDGSSASKFPEAFGFLGKGKLVGEIPFYLVLIIGLYLFFIFIMTKSRYGRFLYAAGSNEEASRISGIGTQRVIMVSYVISALMAATAGLVMISRLMACDPTYGKGAEMDVIAAVVIGGASMLGGRGTLWGTAIGVFIVGVLRNSLNLLGVNTFWQGTAIGVVIIVAVLTEQLSHKKKG